MSLYNILVFIAAAILIQLAVPISGRKWALFVSSILAIYWMQPSTPIRYLDFWLPTATLALAVLSWAITNPQGNGIQKESWLAGLILVSSVLLIAATRYVSLTGILTPSRPPQIWIVGIGLTLSVALTILVLKLPIRETGRETRLLLAGTILFYIALFLILKTPVLARAVSSCLRSLSGQVVERASAFDIRWLGFSYVSFRLLHTLRDRQMGRLPEVTLLEYIIYVIFFPAFTAGPIDRLERFIQDLRQPTKIDVEDIGYSGQRLFIGLFKKFVVADSLALIALSGQNALQVKSTGWMWFLVYAYAFLIYFDFSGYTDIAIGLGKLMGIKLPENFNKPYQKPNLTQFWNNWHITLTMWFRAYFFNPITRSLRRNHKELSPWAIILITQISTMVLIALWHGVSWNFIIWGLWHGLGLFVQNRYSEWVKTKSWAWLKKPEFGIAIGVLNPVLTFNFVALGWVWFVLPTPELSAHVFRQLFGLL